MGLPDCRASGVTCANVNHRWRAVTPRLLATLENVARLDLLIHDSVRNAHRRLVDIGFDPAANEVVLAPG